MAELNLVIRDAKPEDAESISSLIRENTFQVKENHYTRKQLEVWINHTRPEAVRKLMGRRKIFCGFSGQKLAGTIALEEGEVTGLYVAFPLLRKGIGKDLLRFLENYANNLNFASLSLTATAAGLPFYLAHGYTILGAETLVVDGVSFHETRMFKKL